MKKIRVKEVVVVEGKYDAVKLADIIDGMVVSINGFSIFTSKETKKMIQTLARTRGIVILTDSDAAGFRIRAYLNQLAQGLCVKNAYVPSIKGKEKRKSTPSKEGLLGVEGMQPEQIVQALIQAGVHEQEKRVSDCKTITYTDLFTYGLSGQIDSAHIRRAFLQKIGLPERISKKSLLEVLNTLYTYDEFVALLQ